MGQDKAAMLVDGRPALTNAVNLLDAHCERVFVSVRAGHADALRTSYDTIEDRHGGTGPADGIASAEDFLAALARAGGKEVADALGSFLDQNGVPLITAELDCEGEGPPKLSLR